VRGSTVAGRVDSGPPRLVGPAGVVDPDAADVDLPVPRPKRLAAGHAPLT
jgi:hypothetical protein